MNSKCPCKEIPDEELCPGAQAWRRAKQMLDDNSPIPLPRADFWEGAPSGVKANAYLMSRVLDFPYSNLRDDSCAWCISLMSRVGHIKLSETPNELFACH